MRWQQQVALTLNEENQAVFMLGSMITVIMDWWANKQMRDSWVLLEAETHRNRLNQVTWKTITETHTHAHSHKHTKSLQDQWIKLQTEEKKPAKKLKNNRKTGTRLKWELWLKEWIEYRKQWLTTLKIMNTKSQRSHHLEFEKPQSGITKKTNRQ